MKLICNSKVLAAQIKKAFEQKAELIYCEQRGIAFTDRDGYNKVIVDGALKEGFRDPEVFDVIAWYRVMVYLKKQSVPEQPVTVEFHTGNKIDVYAVNVFEGIPV